MNMLLARHAAVSTTVLFDATTHVNRLPAFGRGLTTGFAARKAERAGRQTESDAFFAAALDQEAELDRKYGPMAPLTTEELGQAIDDHFGPLVPPVESCKAIEQWEADEAVLLASFDAPTSAEDRAWQRMLGEAAYREAITPRPDRTSYTRQDLADLAAGRLLTAEQVADRQDAEDEMRLLAQCPADVECEFVFEA